ncbi:putative RNA-directed DNA polymerase [Tanacetum coccineum]|uniref:RNA-directed DNA polymerase n=1 Tax=Tanacetum coccineum TaxID=301880 RepID=A0ABQ4Z528_9ASTR
MIELRANVELKDTIMVAMPKLIGEGFYTCTIRVEYEWKPPMCTCCKIFSHVVDECPKNIGLDVAKNLKNPIHAPRGVPVGPKMGFKLVKQVYIHVSKKNNAHSCGNKKKHVKANYDGPSFFNVGSSSTNTTPIVDKNDKLERLIIDGKITIADDEGKPLEKVDYSGDHYSEETYRNADYDDDPYDDDMYKGQEIPDNI